MDKKKKKLNLIDIVAAVALLTLAAVLIYVFLSGAGIGGERVHVRYVLKADMLQSEFCTRPTQDEPVYDGETEGAIGKVTAVSSVPAKHEGVDRNGAFVTTEIEGYSNLYLTIEASAVKTEKGYLIGDTLINVGKNINTRLASLYCEANCISIEITED